MKTAETGSFGYRELYQCLHDRIISGEIAGRLPSVAELSREFHVNHNTVTKAVVLLKEYRFVYGMQGKGVFVNPDAEVNLLACKRIALYLHRNVLDYPFYIRLVFSLRSLLEHERCEVNIINSVAQLEAFAGRVDVLVLFEKFEEAEMHRVRELIGAERLIFCNCPAPDGELRLGCDNIAGGRMAADYMYALGCRRLGVLRVQDCDNRRSHFFLRWQGVQMAAKEYPALELFEEIIPVAELNSPMEARHVEALLAQGVDGMILSFDLLAFAVYDGMRGRQISLPVLGYDDRDFATYFIPGLSSIREDEATVAAEAVRQIREVLADGGKRHYTLSAPVLIPRAGTEAFRKK